MEERRPRRYWIKSVVPAASDTTPIASVRELLDHKDVKTTMVYTHVLNRGVWPFAALWNHRLPGIDLLTDSYCHSVLNWQEKRVRTWRCDSPIMRLRVTRVQSAATD